MGQRDTPIVHQRRLRGELRKLREAIRLTQKQVAERLDWSVSKIIRIENGTTNVGITDLRALLQLYGVTSVERVGELVDEARASRRSVWWTPYKSMIDAQLFAFIGYEASAIRICQYQSLTIPGLLQTPEYTRALASAIQDDPEAVQRGVDIRVNRQTIVSSDGPELQFILDEAVLRRYVGGVEVMLGQWRRILERARLPNVSIMVLPFTSGEHRGMRGSFSILDLPEGGGRVLVLEEPLRDVMIRDDEEDMLNYVEAFGRLRGMVMSEENSIAFIEGLIAEASS